MGSRKSRRDAGCLSDVTDREAFLSPSYSAESNEPLGWDAGQSREGFGDVSGGRTDPPPVRPGRRANGKSRSRQNRRPRMTRRMQGRSEALLRKENSVGGDSFRPNPLSGAPRPDPNTPSPSRKSLGPRSRCSSPQAFLASQHLKGTWAAWPWRSAIVRAEIREMRALSIVDVALVTVRDGTTFSPRG